MLELLFLCFILGMLFALIGVLTFKNSVMSVISLIGFFINGSSLLFFFKAEYLGIVYIIVYVGAIAVLFLFVVMMLDFKESSSLFNYRTEYFVASVLFVFLFLIYVFSFFYKFLFYNYQTYYFHSSFTYKFWIMYVDPLADISTIGYVLFNYYSVYFLMSGLLLFVSMVGAIILTHFKRENVRVQSLSNQVLRSPKISVYLSNK